MNDFLTQHFLSLKWDKEITKHASNLTINNETVFNVLDTLFQDWSFEISNIIANSDRTIVSVVLYLPGRIISGTGNNETDALINIINRIICTINSKDVQTQTFNSVENTQNKITTKDILADMEQKKNNIIQNQQQNNVFDDLLSGFSENKPIESQPTEVEFESETSNQFEAEFQKTIQKEPETLTSDIVNPSRRIIPKDEWSQNNAGAKLRDWCAKHNVTDKNQISSWLNKFCGLTYDYFDPKYVDNFILWADSLREKQTY